jgi:serine phosphatase RsbU (regulator of sigma subunit)
LVLVFVFSLFIYRSYRQKQKANLIITDQKIEVEKSKLVIEEKNKIVEEKNKDITDSINYAKKIQEAILPSKELKYKLFPDAFVLFQPKAIVSGDFYWFAEKNGKKLIAAVDCTGHGVPGAFMSMIGNAFLNEIINEKGNTIPSEILSSLSEQIIFSLKQTGAEGESKDGMDIALLSIDTENAIIEFAGANNPLWYIRNGIMEKIKGDKQPIGYYKGEQKLFTNHKIEFKKGDSFYIFSDGFVDQFGGKKEKKFKHKQLENILLSIQDKEMLEQEKIILNTFNNWKGDLEQVDDILIIGIRT